MDRYSLPWPSTALAASTAKTMTQLSTPSTARAKIKYFVITFDGATSTAIPVTAEILLQTTAGTASALTPVAEDQTQPAALCTAQHTFTVEPTAGTVMFRFFVHPQGGMFTFQWPLGDEPRIGVSSRIGLRVTAPAIVNCTGWVTYEE